MKLGAKTSKQFAFVREIFCKIDQENEEITSEKFSKNLQEIYMENRKWRILIATITVPSIQYNHTCLSRKFWHNDKPTYTKCRFFHKGGEGLWCLMPLSIIYQLYHGDLFYWWRKLEYLEKSLINFQTQNVSGDRHRLHR